MPSYGPFTARRTHGQGAVCAAVLRTQAGRTRVAKCYASFLSIRNVRSAGQRSVVPVPLFDLILWMSSCTAACAAWSLRSAMTDNRLRASRGDGRSWPANEGAKAPKFEDSYIVWFVGYATFRKRF